MQYGTPHTHTTEEEDADLGARVHDVGLRGVALGRLVEEAEVDHRVQRRLVEVERARMTLLTRHETELKTNAYWVDLMQYTALGEVLAPAKDVSCIADLPAMYEAATVEDLYGVYQQLGLDDGEVFTCVTVAGKEDPALAAAAAPPTAAGAAAAAAAFGAPVGEGDAGMRAAAAAAASLGMAMNGGMAIAEALKKMGGGARAAVWKS